MDSGQAGDAGNVGGSGKGALGRLIGFLSSREFAIIAGILILALAVFVRLGLAHDQGLFEPDGFFYYAIVKATLAGHLAEPQHLALSGFPAHNFIGEAPGLPYLAVIFYLLVGWSGISALTIMRMLPVLFGLVEVVMAYLIARELTDSRPLGLLSMFFLAVSNGNIARSAALVYRGDSFISVPLMVALYLMIRAVNAKSVRKEVAFALLGSFVLSTGILIWNGGPFIVAVYFLAAALMVGYAFVAGNRELSRKTLILVGCLFLTFVLEGAYVALGGARTGLTFTGGGFLIFYTPVLAAALLSYLILYKRLGMSLFYSRPARAGAAGLVVLLVGAALFVGFHGYIDKVAGLAGISSAGATNSSRTSAANISYAVGSTTQELQKPSYPFIFASFGFGIFLAPIGALMFLLLGSRIAGSDRHLGKRLHLEMNAAYIILLAYLLITGFLQYNSIRYNALVSIPIAIFEAYAVFGALALAGRLETRNMALIAVVVIVLALAALYFLAGEYRIGSEGLAAGFYAYTFEALLAGGALAAVVAYMALAVVRGNLQMRYVAYGFVGALAIFALFQSSIEAYSSTQADGINPMFLSAMAWMGNPANTPANSTVLALWPDGSVVEGWGNRTSYMDSVGGENTTRIFYFARFLLNTSPETQYLYRIGKPEYLVSRRYWLDELPGLAAEGIPPDPNNYSYSMLTPLSIQQVNASSNAYIMGSGSYRVGLVSSTANGITKWSAYLGTANSAGGVAIGNIVFYNMTNNEYAEQGGGGQGPYVLIVFYSGSQIANGMLLTRTLYDSNLFKFVMLCNSVQCPYNTDANATLRLVYQNNDTRIFKINYQ